LCALGWKPRVSIRCIKMPGPHGRATVTLL
jgi:hypothetical protein